MVYHSSISIEIFTAAVLMVNSENSSAFSSMPINIYSIYTDIPSGYE